MIPGSENSDRTLILLEDMQSKIHVIAEGHLQLVEGQKRLESRLQNVEEGQQRLENRMDAMEFRLSRQIDHISKRVDVIEHTLS